ncbi:MAG: hypothetical protein WCV62_02930 [Candidatus Peribacteraceae bacterium]|jgi:hypothetical protein
MLQLSLEQETLCAHLVALNGNPAKARAAVVSMAAIIHDQIERNGAPTDDERRQALQEEAERRAEESLLQREHWFCTPDPAPAVRETIRQACISVLTEGAPSIPEEEDDADPAELHAYRYRHTPEQRRRLKAGRAHRLRRP